MYVPLGDYSVLEYIGAGELTLTLNSLPLSTLNEMVYLIPFTVPYSEGTSVRINILR